MSKVAATDPPREKHHCGARVIRARSGKTGHVVLIEDCPGGGRVTLQLDLAGGLPVAGKSERHTRFKFHRCLTVKV